MSVVVVCCCGFFFFFKQKTAYEMRISDWSSDVCSSDLQTSRISKSNSEFSAFPVPFVFGFDRMSGPYRRPAAKRPRALRHHRPDQGEHTVATSSRVSLTLTFKAKLYILIVIVCAALAAVSAAAIYGAGRMAEAGETLGAAVSGSQVGAQVSLLVDKQRGLVPGAAGDTPP